jgi:electron transfer flavoprotein alpha subunit
METILLLVHVEADGSLAKPALEALTAARTIRHQLSGSTLAVGLIGADGGAAASQIGSCGALRFLGVSGAEFAEPRYSSDAAAAEALVRAAGATLVLAPATSRWARSLAGVTQRVNGRIDTHITGAAVVDGQLNVARWYYRQRMEALLHRTQRPWFLLLDVGCHEPWSGEAAAETVESVSVEYPEPVRRTRFVEFRVPQSGEQTIRPEADLLFVTGAGWTKKQPDGKTHVEDAAALIIDFLRKTQSSLGSSKSLVDLSGEGQAVLPFLSHLNQVGQTGSTPRHPKGLATCCHGEEPHVVGWRFVTERRAVNLDANCGWARGKADVLYVADAFEVMRRVSELLAAE